jgi:hypothetical protein
VLLEHPGEVVSREMLQHQLWGADTTRGSGRPRRESAFCGDTGQAWLPVYRSGKQG